MFAADRPAWPLLYPLPAAVTRKETTMNMMKNRTSTQLAPATWMEPVEGRLLMSGDLAASETTTQMETCTINFTKVQHEYNPSPTQPSSSDRPTESLSLNFTRL